MPERPTGRAPQALRGSGAGAPRLRAGRGLRSLRPRAQKVVETKVQTCDGAAHKSSRLESFSKLGRIFRNNTTKFGGIQNETCAEAKATSRLVEPRPPALRRRPRTLDTVHGADAQRPRSTPPCRECTRGYLKCTRGYLKCTRGYLGYDGPDR